MVRGTFYRIVGLAACVGLVTFLAYAGRILYLNDPQPAEVILVLNGGTWARVATGLEALRREESSGQGPAASDQRRMGLRPGSPDIRLILDVDANAVEWGQTEDEMARHWIGQLPAAERAEVATCPSAALSTEAEARLVQRCLEGARKVLIVTSDYHTRRALEVFRHVDPSRRYFVLGAHEPAYFGVDWWRHREWAKTTLQEWGKLLWWEGVDRWRG